MGGRGEMIEDAGREERRRAGGSVCVLRSR